MVVLGPESMVEIRLITNALSGSKMHRFSGSYPCTDSVDGNDKRFFSQHFSFLVGLPQTHAEDSSAPVDDVFRFQPMEMGRSNLSAADKHNLFTIGFVFLLQTSITEGYQSQADFQEIAPAEVGQVPAHGSFPDIITFQSFAFPVVRSPVRPWRQHEVILCHKCFGFADILIDFTAFHICLFFKVLYFYFFNNSFSGIAWN